MSVFPFSFFSFLVLVPPRIQSAGSINCVYFHPSLLCLSGVALQGRSCVCRKTHPVLHGHALGSMVKQLVHVRVLSPPRAFMWLSGVVYGRVFLPHSSPSTPFKKLRHTIRFSRPARAKRDIRCCPCDQPRVLHGAVRGPLAVAAARTSLFVCCVGVRELCC